MDLAFWRDVALVVLAVEALIFGLVPLALFFFAIRGLRWLDRRVRLYGPQARERWHLVHRRVKQTTDQVSAPFRRLEEVGTIARTFLGSGEPES